jgi:hypothetical protein
LISQAGCLKRVGPDPSLPIGIDSRMWSS